MNAPNSQHKEVVPEEVYKEVMTNYYKGVFGLADTARGRSQAAWAIASAIAGALVAAGVVKNLSAAAIAVQALGGAAVFAWLATGATFMWALVTPLPHTPPETRANTEDEVRLAFIRNALLFYRSDLDHVQRRQRLAVLVTCLAILITVAAGSAGLAIGKPIDTVPATVSLNDDGKQTAEALCGHPVEELSGRLRSDSLKKDNLVIEVELGVCNTSQAVIVIPRKQVSGVESTASIQVIPM